MNCNADHLVDGGYYDNYGMSTLNAWVRQGLTANELAKDKLPLKKILIVRIVSFPNDKETEPPAEPWYYQIGVPLLTMYNVRGESQGLRNAAEFWAAQQLLLAKGVDVQIVEFNMIPRTVNAVPSPRLCRGTSCAAKSTVSGRPGRNPG